MWMQVLLADDQPEVRLALRVLLEQSWDLMPVGEATNAEGLLVYEAHNLPQPGAACLGTARPVAGRFAPCPVQGAAELPRHLCSLTG
jgi:hypothetical protein